MGTNTTDRKMSRYYVQVFFVKYFEVEADSELEAKEVAKLEFEKETQDKFTEELDFTYTVTDKLDEES